jgi:hypothetical protein
MAITLSGTSGITMPIGSASNASVVAWANFSGVGTSGSATIRGSYNVSSITINSAGYWTVNLASAIQDINYSVVGSLSATSGTGQTNTFQPFVNPTTGLNAAPTTTSFVCSSMNGGGTQPVYANIAVFR